MVFQGNLVVTPYLATEFMEDIGNFKPGTSNGMYGGEISQGTS
jgi:hypothetical protein